ncbi:OmpA/MotB family protein [Aureibaculum luteum]|uniref:OmpA/MotB family protein n=1 Tax=Aureibaculum luteum TaxID=1548456 RepID=UPI000E499EBA|nr:OmpA family protein [Aureibaculum luteum]
MKKILFLSLSCAILLSSCVSQKKYDDLLSQYDTAKTELTDAKAKVLDCQVEKDKFAGMVANLEAQNKFLTENHAQSIRQIENLTTLSQSASGNIKDIVAQLSEKDKYINGIRGAMSRKDSINLTLAVHLKSALADGIQDEDIIVNVEKTVVYVEINDKLLFRSGSSIISNKAKNILDKVATVIASRPEMEVMVEGYTDSQPISTAITKDNWDLSTQRATAVVRVLQDDFKIDPKRLIAAGRSEYLPLATNNTAEGRSRNRRTRIVILPKLDQFFDILEQKPDGTPKSE